MNKARSWGGRTARRGGVGGWYRMWVMRCEILRMTLLKLNMSESNTITIKWKVLEGAHVPMDLSVCTRGNTLAHFVPVEGKLLREPSVRSCTKGGSPGLIRVIERHTFWIQSPVMRPQSNLHVCPCNYKVCHDVRWDCELVKVSFVLLIAIKAKQLKLPLTIVTSYVVI